VKNVRVTKPSIEVGYSSGAEAITNNGQAYDQSPRVAGAAYASGAPVIAVRAGRKLIAVGTGGLYPARTTL
jgi:hypothetical protein